MASIPYEPTASSLLAKMNPLLQRAKAGETGLLPELDRIAVEFEAAVESGWVDWEGQFSFMLRGLSHWCRRAAGVPSDWHEHHSKECGTTYRGCAPDCPKDVYEKTGVWTEPSETSA